MTQPPRSRHRQATPTTRSPDHRHLGSQRQSHLEKLFKDLLKSVKEGGEILRGKRRPKREFRHDVKSVREKTGLSQSQFALLIGVKVKTLQNWEQGRRRPRGPARALLKIVQADPKRALRALHAAS